MPGLNCKGANLWFDESSWADYNTNGLSGNEPSFVHDVRRRSHTESAQAKQRPGHRLINVRQGLR